jgi:hypothetical protein
MGEVSSALSSAANFNRWGAHYLRFVGDASRNQRRNNFKDPGGMVYGGKLFCEQLAKLNDAFSQMGVPTPSLMPVAASTASPAVFTVYQATVSGFADAYNNAQGGCFDLGCMVHMVDGSLKTVADVRKGDVVATGLGGCATVAVVVE